MVDPNRKININLSDDDAAFLVECEQEFRNRYTQADEEFAAFIEKPTRPPPVVEPFGQTKHHHHGDSSGGNWNRNNYRQSNNRNHQGNQFYNRNNDNRSQYYRNSRPQNRPYDRNYRRGADSGGGSKSF